MKFGQLMSKIEELLINSYISETTNIELKNFKKLVIEDKNTSSMFHLYTELSNKKGLDKTTADLYINESLRQIDKIVSKLNTQRAEYWVKDIVVENKYQDIDNLVYNNPNKIMENVESRKTLINFLNESPEVKDYVNLPMETVLNIANKSIEGYLNNLDETSKKELSKVLMTEDVELSKEFDDLKTKTVKMLSNITESLDNITSKKIQETIESVKNEIYSKINYVRLFNLYNNIS
jgi:hypothetical protein